MVFTSLNWWCTGTLRPSSELHRSVVWPISSQARKIPVPCAAARRGSYTAFSVQQRTALVMHFSQCFKLSALRGVSFPVKGVSETWPDFATRQQLCSGCVVGQVKSVSVCLCEQ